MYCCMLSFLHPLLNFTEKDGAVFCEGLTRCQCHDHRDTPIMSGDGNRCVMEHGIHKRCHLSDEALGIALDEEVERQIAPDTFAIADDCGVRVIVSYRDCSCAAQQFQPLIITIGSMTAVADRTDHTVSKLQHDHRGVNIARRTDGRIVHHACQNKDLLHFAPNQKTGHIKVMDCHIEEDTAGDCYIFNWWRVGIIADEVEQLWLTDLTLFNSLSHTTIIGIKAPIEANLQFYARAFHDIQRSVNRWEIKR